MLPVPPAEGFEKVACLNDPRDAHVLAAALGGGSELLLTLDRRHILVARKAVEEAALPICILTPGDFIWQYYPLHDEYSSLPPRSE